MTWNLPSPQYCVKCGLAHWPSQPCPSFRADVPPDPMRDMEEEYEIRRWNTLQALADAARRGEKVAAAYARLDMALRNL